MALCSPTCRLRNDPCQPFVAANLETGGSGLRSTQPQLLWALRLRWLVLSGVQATASNLAAVGVLWRTLRAVAPAAAQLQPAVALVCGPEPDDPIWHATTFSKKRERLLIELADHETHPQFLLRPQAERARGTSSPSRTNQLKSELLKTSPNWAR